MTPEKPYMYQRIQKKNTCQPGQAELRGKANKYLYLHDYPAERLAVGCYVKIAPWFRHDCC